MKTPINRTSLLLLSLGALASCSGSSASTVAGTSQPPLNGGGLEVDDFDYADSHPGGFHPLGDRETTLLERAELSWMASTSTPGRQSTVLDDLYSPDSAAPAYTVLSSGAASFTDGYEIHHTLYANIDSDGENELLALGVDPLTDTLSLRILDAGTAQPVFSIDIATATNWVDAELAVGDIDGDGRDEIAITGTNKEGGAPANTSLYVLDDADAFFAVLHSSTGDVNSREQRIQMGDLDGDGDDELVVLTTDAAYDYPLATLRVYQYGQAGIELAGTVAPAAGEFHPLIPQEGAHGLESSYGYTMLEVADFDADGADEIVVIADSAGALEFACYDGLEEGVPSALGLIKPRTNMGGGGGVDSERYGPDHRIMFAACDASQAAGFELVGYFVNDDANNFSLGQLVHYADILGGSISSDYFLVEQQGFEGIDEPTGLVACDDDGDALDELIIVTQSGSSNNSQLRLRRFELVETYDQNSGTFTSDLERTHRDVYTSNNFQGGVMLAAGDFEGDGIALRYTGEEFLEVANPIPLVVLVAPPTKAGTSQALDFTGASYSFSQSAGVTREVSYSMSYSSELSGTVGSVLTGNYARKAEEGYTKSLGSTRLLTEFVEYNGIASDDYVIFHGLLVQRYVYDIVRTEDPDLRGTQMVINVPVQAQQYFWTRDYYNENVDPEAQIGEDVLSHTIGDPSSYVSYQDVEDLRNSGTDLVWWNDQGQPIPQGGGTSGHGFELSEENSTGGEFTESSSESIGGKVDLGFLEGGYSETTTHGEANLYSITLGEATRYSALIGGIPNGDEYQSWVYNWGLYVRNYQGGDGRVFQILDFWTTPFGTDY